MRKNGKQDNNRKRRRLLAWLLFYLALFAGFIIFFYQEGKRINTVSTPSGKIVLTTSKNQYTVGQTVSFTITNQLQGGINIYVNNKCPSEPLNVYRWKSSNHTWTQLHATAKLSSCAGQPPQVKIPSGKSVTSTYDNWPKLFSKPGIYRLLALIDNYNHLVYRDFDVVAKPTKAPTTTRTIIQQVPVYVPVPTSNGGEGGD